MTPEVLTVGRVSVDLTPSKPGVTLAEVRTFRTLPAEVEVLLCAA